MKISTFLATGLGVFLLAGAANAATVTYTATLTGAQSLNTTTSTATAKATLNYDDVAKTLTGNVVYPGDTGTGFTIKPSGGHLKSGACTETGTIISALTVDTDAPEGGLLSLNNTTPLDDDQIAALTTGGLFLTIENTTYPSPESEIRGQIVADGAANDLCAAAIAALASSGAYDGGTDSGTTPIVDTDAGTTTPVSTTTVDDSGCNTTGSTSPGSNAALALGLGLALYGIARKRKQA